MAMAVLSDLGLYLWRLLPANPILVRVVAAAGKRVRHLWARVAYLVALIAVFLFGGGLLLGGEVKPLSELAKQASQTFTAVSIVQLVLMSFVAPVFCAGAITQEKDANTFHILLTTPLSNGQIVLGSLFSRLYFVWALLISGLPIFCITMLYGGVTTREIFESFGLAACTGLVTGSIAIMISFLRVGTRRTIFAFFGGIAIYLLGVYSIGLSPAGQLAAAPAATGAAGTMIPGRMSWLAPLHPFLALLVVTGRTPAPDWADVAGFTWPFDWLAAYPQYGYMLVSTLASVVMIAICLFCVRRGAQDREAGGWLNALVQRFTPVAPGAGERTRRSRRVWRNPIAWREAATRGSAGGQSAMRWLFVVAGCTAGLTLVIAHHCGWWGLGPNSVATTRSWLTALIWIELLVVLLVITSTAATTLTREKESATMEMLLTTPLTSRYIIAGMLQGLVRLVIPLIAIPTFTLCAIAIGDLGRWSTSPVTALEAVFAVPAVMIAFAALAGMVGLHFSLQFKKTVQSVMVSTAVVLGAAGLLWACGVAVAGSGGAISAVVLPFTPFPAVWALIDPWSLVGRQSAYQWGGGAPSAADVAGFRVAACVFTLVAIAVYAGITYAFYAAMVRDFDMTVRKQSV
jgi:ABC-type transport system involved in multi-copper enzyme maturation permease subunit